MDAAQGFVLNKAIEGFEAQGKFAQGEGLLGFDIALTQFCEIVGGGVFRAVDDAEVFAPSALDGRLNQPAFFVAGDERDRFDDHALAALRCDLLPPSGGVVATLRVVEIDDAIGRGVENIRIRTTEFCEGFHVPGVCPVMVNRAFCGEDVKGREFEIVEAANGPAVRAVRVDVAVDAPRTRPVLGEVIAHVDPVCSRGIERVQSRVE